MTGKVETIEMTLERMSVSLETLARNSVKVEQMDVILTRHDKSIETIKLDLQTVKGDIQDLKELEKSDKEDHGPKTIYTAVGTAVVTYLLTKLPALIAILEGGKSP